MKWVYLHIQGQVQGVGFRPFVYKLAKWLNLAGWVGNDVDGVHIEAGGTKEQLELFEYLLRDSAPPESRITNISSREIEASDLEEFHIKESSTRGTPNLLITPDLGLCRQCRQEIHDPGSIRYHYPFTTCTHCGPRYSILQSLPYDRHTTSMHVFKMCPRCLREYNDPNDRRYFSQTNSCPECPVNIRLVSNSGKTIANSWNEALPALLRSLEQGHILAIKGIGGYLLMTDATNPDAIKTLRDRKHRPQKPFALMYPDIGMLKQDADLIDEEQNAFLSTESPVVLVTVKPNPASKICTSLIAPGLNSIGVMQPYTAMFELLMKSWNKPVIATSGNISGSPVLYKDNEALESLAGVADVFLMHDREIQIAQDDSVIRYSSINKKRIVLRRSRGFAPTYIKAVSGNETMLAMGADLKSTFSLQANGRVYVSQYLGNLESYQSQLYYRRAQEHLIKMMEATPERIIIDRHPQYYSASLGDERSRLSNLSLQKVQHHEAHAWSVLGENDLIDTHDSVLCVVWDGTGYGSDRNSWGGEFFSYSEHELKRIAHATYFPVLLGDRMAKEPRLSALSLTSGLIAGRKILRRKFTDPEWNYYTKLTSNEPSHYTSSIGRLFDAVASLLGLCDKNTFEGQGALYLEALASTATTTARYPVMWKDNELDVRLMIGGIVRDVLGRKAPAHIAYKFHAYLADVVYDLASGSGMSKVAFSGGVFQNALLVDLMISRFGSQDYQLFFHKELSPNDENISFGQLVFARVKNEVEHYLDDELVKNVI